MTKATPYLVAVGAIFGLSTELSAGPVGTAFTYQGRIKQAGVLVTVPTDFEFTLWDAATNGLPVGPTLTFDGQGDNPPPLTPDNGLFSAPLDFGAGVFNGNDRWLEISVRSPAGGGAWVNVSPRQLLSPSPYSLFSVEGTGGNSLQDADGTPNALFINSNGDLGIGTTTPTANVHILSPGSRMMRLERTGSSLSPWEVYITAGGAGGLGFFNTTMSEHNLFLTDDGNVGIGTTDPEEKLVVSGFVSVESPTVSKIRNTGTIPQFSLFETDSTDLNTRLENNGGIFAIATLADDDTGLTKRLTVDHATGNVGIGTDVPSETLVVRKDQDARTTFRFENRSNSSNSIATVSVGAGVGPTLALNALAENFGDPVQAGRVQLSGNSETKGLDISGAEIRFSTSGVINSLDKVAMSISTNGSSVGIGTTEPEATLHIDDELGTGRFSLEIDAPNGQLMRFERPGSGLGPWEVILTGSGTGGLQFINQDSGATALYLTEGGNVGIGTTTPATELHVCGDIRAEGEITAGDMICEVVGGSCPDYVFAEDYSLMSLDKLGAYLTRNRHLPNVPSAAEVERDGINLGEFQMRLLEKTEELTLYTIEQHKQIKQQRETIQEQEKSLSAMQDRLQKLEAVVGQLAGKNETTVLGN